MDTISRYILSLLLLTTFFLFGCRTAEKIHSESDQFLEAAVEHWNFQGGVLITYKGEPVLMKGYGPSNIPFELDNTTTTKFFIGSLTKQFTAAAILRLDEENKLNISDPICKYIDDFPPEVGDKVTIHHLLSHSSGIPNFTEMPEIFLKRTEPISPEQLMSIIAKTPLEFEPGSRVTYSNSGYIVLGEIIEKVSGQSYEAYLHRKIFKPLEMNNSGYARRSMGLPDRAEGYTLAEGNVLVNAVAVEMSILHSAGALYTTLEDMLQWEQSLVHGDFLTELSLRQMFTPQAGIFGYGWAIDTMYKQVVVYHGGFIDGFNCRIERWLTSGLTTVVFANDDEAPVFKISRSLAAIALGYPYEMPISKHAVNVADDALKKYTGLFSYTDGRTRVIANENDTLHTYIFGFPRQHLFVERDDQLFFEKDNSKILTISFDQSGRAERIIEDNGFTVDTAYRVEDNSQQALFTPRVYDRFDYSTLENFSGEYKLKSLTDEESEFILSVYHSGNRLYAKVIESEPVEVFPLSPTEFFHKTTDYRLIFVTDLIGVAQAVIMRMSGAEVRGVRIQ